MAMTQTALTAQPPTLCGAATKGSGQPCRRPSGWGTDHVGYGACKLHGGSTPTHRRHAVKLMLAHEITSLGQQLDITPEEAILQQVREAAGNVALYRQLVSTFKLEEGGVWVRTESKAKPAEAERHIAVALYDQERDRLARLAKLAIDAGIAERLVRVAEAQGELLAQVVQRALDDPEWGLSAEVRERGRQVFARHMNALEVGGSVVEGRVAGD